MTTLSVAEPEPPLLVDPGPVAGPPFPLNKSKASSQGAAWIELRSDILGKDMTHAGYPPPHIPQHSQHLLTQTERDTT